MTMARYYGSLAATRCLGAHGVPVIVADADPFAPARWSRHVVRRERCPPSRPIGAFVDWLLELGTREPGHVLYPTSDDFAWVIADRQAELRRHFRLFSPPFEAVRRVLDKASLHVECAAAGLATPRTWFPEGPGDLGTVAREAHFPLIIKPRTQVRFRSMAKGTIVTSPETLAGVYARFFRANEYEPSFVAAHPEVRRPFIQEIIEADSIYAISGFVDPRRGIFVTRGSRKLVQWPRDAGVGIVFEDAPVDRRLADGLQRLARSTGFYGVFEAEFVGTGADDACLIDYNPRFFGQMGFDIARGLPSPYLAYLSAIEDDRRFEQAIDAATSWRGDGPMVFVNRAALAWTRAAEMVVGRTPARIPPRLTDGANGSPSYVEAAGFESDWAPAVVDGLGQAYNTLRHPRAVLRAAFRGH